jgi:hypothetical protein
MVAHSLSRNGIELSDAAVMVEADGLKVRAPKLFHQVGDTLPVPPKRKVPKPLSEKARRAKALDEHNRWKFKLSYPR